MIPPRLVAAIALLLVATSASAARDQSKYHLPDEWARSGALFEGTAGQAMSKHTACQVIIAEARPDGYLRLLVTSPKWSFIGYVYEGKRDYELDQRGRPILRFKRVAGMPLADNFASLKKAEPGTWRTLLSLSYYKEIELRLRWEPGKDDHPGYWHGAVFAATDRYELPDTGFQVKVSPVAILEKPLGAAVFKEAWAGAVDGVKYEGTWFNWTSRSSPVTVEFDAMEESSHGVSMTIQNFESRAVYRGRFEISDATANGYAPLMVMHEVLARERDRRVGRIVGGNRRSPPKYAASKSIRLRFRLGIDRETLYGVGHGGDILMLRPVARRDETRASAKKKPDKRRELSPEEQATRDLKLAQMYLRSAKPSTRRVGIERLAALVDRLPNTSAAEQAKTLLAEVEP